MYEVKEEGQGWMSLGWNTGRDPWAEEEQPHFPPVTGGMTKDANGPNQKNGRRGETKEHEKVCRCTPSTALQNETSLAP